MNYKFLLTIVLCILSVLTANGQYENLVHKIYPERFKALAGFYQDVVPFQDSAFIFNTISQIKQIAKDNDDEELLMEAELIKVNYFLARDKYPPSIVLPIIERFKKESIENKIQWALINAENMEALYCFNRLHQYEKGFEHYQRVYDLIKKLKPEKFPYKQNCLNQMADRYYFFGEYRESIFYNLQA